MIYKHANPFHRFMRNLAATRPMAWFFARTLHHMDHPVFRFTKGKHTFASLVSGLPVIMLTTTGAKSGKRRTLPLLGLPDGERMVVIASNYGQRHHPSWYHNLLAHPEATLSVGGKLWSVVACEVEGEERERLWRLGLEVLPGWAGYEQRAGKRRIPIMVLHPENNEGNAESRKGDRCQKATETAPEPLTLETARSLVRGQISSSLATRLLRRPLLWVYLTFTV